MIDLDNSSRSSCVVGSSAPPSDLDAEQAVLGALLLTPSALPAITVDVGLRTDHFYRQRHGLVFAAINEVADQGADADIISVVGRLRDRSLLDDAGGAAFIDGLAGTVPDAGNVTHYARRVKDLADWRTRLLATYKMQAAIALQDLDEFAAAEGHLTSLVDHHGVVDLTPSQVGERAWERLESGDEPEMFPWPFAKLNRLSDGMARGQVTVIAGPTSHGKSVLVDQCLESAGIRQSCTPHLFLNEMTEDERTARTLGRLSGVPWRLIYKRRLDTEQREKIASVVGKIRFGMTEAAGWTAADICRQVRRRGYDLIAVDLVNKLPYHERNRTLELAAASTLFHTLAQQTGCHVILVAHLNRNRVGHDGRRPVPTATDIKDCQALVDDAHNALYVWREQDEETGDPLPDGHVRFSKARGGQLGGLAVRLTGELMRFDPATPREQEEAATF